MRVRWTDYQSGKALEGETVGITTSNDNPVFVILKDDGTFTYARVTDCVEVKP
jgi:hypothetical protein